MADPVRKQIRDAVATALMGNTTAGSKVYASRHKPLNENSQMPALRIIMGVAESELQSMGGALEHRADLVVQCLDSGGDDLDDRLDVLGSEVTAILGGNLLSDVLKSIELGELQMEFDTEGSRPAGAQILTFYVTYWTPQNDLTTAL